MNLPKEFEEKMKTLLGSEYEEYTACYDEPRHYGLRVNTAKISVEDFLKIAPWPLEPVPWIENGFYYDGDHIQPSKHPYYFAGLYYLQEPSAMTPASRLPVEPGDRVLGCLCRTGWKSDGTGSKITGDRCSCSQRLKQFPCQRAFKESGAFRYWQYSRIKRRTRQISFLF